MTGILDAKTPAEPSLATLAYKPEQTWNYELGGHLTLVPQHLQMFYTFFYMHTKTSNSPVLPKVAWGA